MSCQYVSDLKGLFQTLKSTHVSNLEWLSQTIKSTLLCMYILRRPQTVKSVFSLYSTIGRFICLYVVANTVEVQSPKYRNWHNNFRCSIPNSLLNTHIYIYTWYESPRFLAYDYICILLFYIILCVLRVHMSQMFLIIQLWNEAWNSMLPVFYEIF